LISKFIKNQKEIAESMGENADEDATISNIRIRIMKLSLLGIRAHSLWKLLRQYKKGRFSLYKLTGKCKEKV
jgi:hypothetical protein